MGVVSSNGGGGDGCVVKVSCVWLEMTMYVNGSEECVGTRAGSKWVADTILASESSSDFSKTRQRFLNTDGKSLKKVTRHLCNFSGD